MSWVEDLQKKYENEFRSQEGFGNTFGFIEDDSYSSGLSEDRVTFGESEVVYSLGNEINYQDIYLDGRNVGYLREINWYDFFMLKPMTISFVIPLEDNEVTEEVRRHPNFLEGEWDSLSFAKLHQLINYLNS